MKISRNIYMRIEKIGENPYVFCIVLAFLLNTGVEALSRKSFLAVFAYFFDRPYVFCYNTLLITFTLSFVLLIKRRIFAFSFLSAVWLGLGVINSILLIFRTTPFTAVDLLLVKSAYSIMENYFSKRQIVYIETGLTVALVGIVILWWKAPKRKSKISYKNVLLYIFLLFCLFKLFTEIGFHTQKLAKNFGNIGEAYLEYGFPYCFGNSLVNTGIDKPKEYSPEIIDELIKEVEAPVQHIQNTRLGNKAKPEKELPNIIYLQLESFFDPYYVKTVEFSSDPIPMFHYLKENYISGFLNVPSVGAGTANTEFEVITGMNLDFFGPGEYPYKTILQETTCESIAYNMKELGFKAHAIHNNEGTFYERHKVFAQLGFDTFTPIEYMNVQEKTIMGWAKDFILTEEIRKALNSTEERDVIYTISVQGHGSYPEEKILENPTITLLGMEEGRRTAFEYYVNQISEMDQFLKELIDMLSQLSEDTVLVLYGDHLPGFGFTDDELQNENIFQTEYVIWSNFRLEGKDRDLEAFQLSSYVMELLDLYNGILTKYHRTFSEQESYLEGLKILEYDMLYGKQKVYGGITPYPVTDLTMGVEKIEITNIFERDKTYFIEGKHFTEYSKIFVNDEEIDCEFLNETALQIENYSLSDGDKITVRQVGRDKYSLGSTEPYYYKQKQ